MKSLRILLGNNSLNMFAGSELWTYTLAVALGRMGHHVACFSPDLGVISHELGKENILSYSGFSGKNVQPFSPVFEEHVDHQYDIIIASHHHIVSELRNIFPKTPIISVIHGIIHFFKEAPALESSQNPDEWAPEHPALSAGVNQFVAVSEEVREKLKKDYNIDASLIRNFFDLKRFSDTRPVSFPPKQFFVNTNYAGPHDPEIEIVREVARYFGAKLVAIGINFTPTFSVETALRDSDIVFGMGRSVLEGVATGRLGIVHGRWGTGGVVCEKNIEELRSCNFSGRNSSGLATKEEIIAMIEEYYKPETIAWGIQYMKREHNVETAADSFIRIARELIEGPAESELRPYRRASDVA